jgi:hypothetical protein
VEVVAGGGQDSVGGVAPAIPEIVTAHAMLDFEMAKTGSTVDLRRNWRLIWGVTPRFWPEMKILNLQSGGALWPRYPLSVRIRWRVLPTMASMSGITVARV